MLMEVSGCANTAGALEGPAAAVGCPAEGSPGAELASASRLLTKGRAERVHASRTPLVGGRAREAAGAGPAEEALKGRS